jgi:hypothetical protein
MPVQYARLQQIREDDFYRVCAAGMSNAFDSFFVL